MKHLLLTLTITSLFNSITQPACAPIGVSPAAEFKSYRRACKSFIE